jgi:hypothetical protein
MKRARSLAYLILAAVAFWAINPHVGHSRMIGTNPTGNSADQWCVGGRIVGNVAKLTTEVCVDSSGNLIPTTTNTGALGTASLQWASAQIAGAVNAASVVPTDTASSRLHIPSGAAVSSTTLASVVTSTGDVFMIFDSGHVAPIPVAVCISSGGGGAFNIVLSSKVTQACTFSY